jgi:hypothetical protein
MTKTPDEQTIAELMAYIQPQPTERFHMMMEQRAWNRSHRVKVLWLRSFAATMLLMVVLAVTVPSLCMGAQALLSSFFGDKSEQVVVGDSATRGRTIDFTLIAQ